MDMDLFEMFDQRVQIVEGDAATLVVATEVEIRDGSREVFKGITLEAGAELGPGPMERVRDGCALQR